MYFYSNDENLFIFSARRLIIVNNSQKMGSPSNMSCAKTNNLSVQRHM